MHFNEIKWPGEHTHHSSSTLQLANKVLSKLRFPWAFRTRIDPKQVMVSTEQVINFQHLVSRVIEEHIPGDFVELGCYTGATTAVISCVLHAHADERPFHVYDGFGYGMEHSGNVRKVFEDNVQRLGLPLPIVHEGDLFAMLPDELPESIAFVHIDVGVGGDHELHGRLVTLCLEHVYPRMSSGAIAVLMDHHVEGVTVGGFNANPGMTKAAIPFFKHKPETVYTLFGGPYSHGYFRKK